MVVNMNYINKEASFIVKSLLDNGWILSPTMSGHQGECYKVDLRKNNDVIRVLVNRQRAKIYCAHVVAVIMEKFENVKSSNDMYKGKELMYTEFYILNDYIRNNEVYFTDYEEFKVALDKHNSRIENHNYFLDQITMVKNMPINSKIVDIVKNTNTKGYKSITKKDIERVYSTLNHKLNKTYTIRINKNGKVFELRKECKK